MGGIKSLLRLQTGNTYFDKVVEQVDPLLKGFLQVFTECEVLGVVADLIHTSSLSLLRSLFCPVIVVISVLTNTHNHKLIVIHSTFRALAAKFNTLNTKNKPKIKQNQPCSDIYNLWHIRVKSTLRCMSSQTSFKGYR